MSGWLSSHVEAPPAERALALRRNWWCTFPPALPAARPVAAAAVCVPFHGLHGRLAFYGLSK